MPDLGGKKYLEELWIGIKADISDFKEGLNKTQRELRTFTNRVGASSEQLKKMGTRLTIISGALTVMGGLAVRVFAQFEQSMANTFSVLGANAEQMQRLTKFARQMGSTTIFTASQSADAMYYLASAGFDTEKIMGSLQGTLNLAAATQYDLAETTRIVVSTLNQFGLAAEDATRVSNVFSAVISKSQATMDKIGNSMKFAGTSAANLGISVEQLSAIFGILFNAGLQSSQAGTAMRQVFIKLQKPTNDAIDALHKMGLTVEDVNPQFHDMIEIIRAFEEVGADAITMGDELATIFDVRAMLPMQVLIRQGADALEELEMQITNTNKSQEMADIQLNTLTGSLKLLKSAAEELAVSFGTGIVPILRMVVDTVKDLINTYNQLPQATKTIVSTTFLLTTALTGLSGIVLLLLSRIPAMIAAFKSIPILASIGFGKIMLLVTAVAALAGGILYLITAEERQNRVTTDTINRLKQNANERMNVSKQTKEMADEYLALEKIENKTAQQEQKMNEILSDLNGKYPSIIKNTNDYEGAVEDVGKVSRVAGNEIKFMADELKRLREIEILRELTELRNQTRDLTDDLNRKTLINPFAVLTKNSDTFKGNLADIDNILSNTGKSVKGAFTDIGRNTLVVKYAELENVIKEIVKDETKSKELNEDMTNIIKKRAEIDSMILELKNNQNKEDNTQIGALRKTGNVLGEILTIYSESLGTSLKIQSNTIRENELLREQKILNGEIAQLAGQMPEKRPDPFTDSDEEEQKDALRNAQRIEDLRLDMKRATLEQELALEEFYADKSLQRAINYSVLDFDLKKLALEREKISALRTVEEVGEGKEEVMKHFADREIALEKQLAERIKQLRLEASQDSADELEARYEAEERAIEDLLRFKADMELRGETGYEGSLQRYRDYLAEKLLYEKEWSEEYVSLLREIANVEQAMREESKERYRDYVDIIGRGMSGAINGFWNEFILSSRRAKDSWDAVWLSFKNSALTAIRDIINSKVIGLFVDFFTNVLGSVFGGLNPFSSLSSTATIGSPTRLGYVGKGVFPFGQYGAMIKKSGVMGVHKDEMLIPANVVRKHRDGYDNVIEKKSNTENNFHVSIPISNPMVDDRRFWEIVVEKNIVPAIERLSERRGK